MQLRSYNQDRFQQEEQGLAERLQEQAKTGLDGPQALKSVEKRMELIVLDRSLS